MQDEEIHKNLDDIRGLIDSVDSEILQLLKHRSLLVNQVTEVKRATRQAPHQPDRFARMKERLHELAEQEGVEQQLVDEIWDAIHHSSLRQQAKELEDKS